LVPGLRACVHPARTICHPGHRRDYLSLEWGIILLITVCIAEITGNTILYSLVKWKKLPDFVEKAIKKWTGFIIFSDERIILLNRIAPILPFTGAFIATCKWNYKKSMLYLAIGGLLKYSALLAMVAFFKYSFDSQTAQLVSLAAVVIVICLSLVASYIIKNRKNASQQRP
jgi:membrane protein DedA with SNARE-associated domain